MENIKYFDYCKLNKKAKKQWRKENKIHFTYFWIVCLIITLVPAILLVSLSNFKIACITEIVFCSLYLVFLIILFILKQDKSFIITAIILWISLLVFSVLGILNILTQPSIIAFKIINWLSFIWCILYSINEINNYIKSISHVNNKYFAINDALTSFIYENEKKFIKTYICKQFIKINYFKLNNDDFKREIKISISCDGKLKKLFLQIPDQEKILIENKIDYLKRI